METTQTKPKPVGLTADVEDGMMTLRYDLTDVDFAAPTKTKTQTAKAEIKFTADDNVRDAQGRIIQSIKVTHTVSDADWLAEKRKRAQNAKWRLFAIAFGKLEAEIMQKFASGEIRFLQKGNNKVMVLEPTVPSDPRGTSYEDLPSVMDLPESERIVDGKAVVLTREKINIAIEKKLETRPKATPDELAKILANMIEARDKEVKDSQMWQLWNVAVEQQERLLKVAQAAAARKPATKSTREQERERLGITSTAADMA